MPNLGALAKAAPAASMPERRPIDVAHLGRQTLGDPGLQAEVLRIFADMLQTYGGRLQASTSRNDLMVNLHALRGAAAGMGAFGLAEAAGVAEDELRAGTPPVQERIDDVGMALEEVQAFIAPMIEADGE